MPILSVFPVMATVGEVYIVHTAPAAAVVRWELLPAVEACIVRTAPVAAVARWELLPAVEAAYTVHTAAVDTDIRHMAA